MCLLKPYLSWPERGKLSGPGGALMFMLQTSSVNQCTVWQVAAW
jgi:hypothetical protein